MAIVRSGRFSDGELRLLGDLTRVVDDTPFLEKAIEQCPDDPGALLGLAEAARTDRRSDEARRLYEQVLRSAPELDEAWAGLGMLARDADEFAAWKRSLPDRPIEHPDLWYARGRSAKDPVNRIIAIPSATTATAAIHRSIARKPAARGLLAHFFLIRAKS